MVGSALLSRARSDSGLTQEPRCCGSYSSLSMEVDQNKEPSKSQVLIVKAKKTPTTDLPAVAETKDTTGSAQNDAKMKSQQLSPLPLKPSMIHLPRTFGKVLISLENCILPNDRLCPTPSFLEGMGARTEWFLRRLGCDIIQHAGILLKLPQTAMATAQVLYQRFYYAKSFVRNHYLTLGMACVYLSSKVEEAPKRIRDIVNVFTFVRQVLCAEVVEPILEYTYIGLKNQIIKAERRLLKELGFCVHVKHPHKLIVMYLQVLEQEQNTDFVQKAWNFMNDSLRTDLFVRFSPEAIACGCIFLAARVLQITLPRKPIWYQLFNVTTEDATNIATDLLLLYSIKLPMITEIEDQLEKLRIAFEKSREKGPRGTIEAGTTKTPGITVNSSPQQLQDKKVGSSRSQKKTPDEKRSRDISADHRGDKRSADYKDRERSPRHRYSKRHSSDGRNVERKRNRSKDDNRQRNRCGEQNCDVSSQKSRKRPRSRSVDR